MNVIKCDLSRKIYRKKNIRLMWAIPQLCTFVRLCLQTRKRQEKRGEMKKRYVIPLDAQKEES